MASIMHQKLQGFFLKNDYEVFMELDDCDIYCVHYADAKYKHFGTAAFYRITEDDVETLEAKRYKDESEEK